MSNYTQAISRVLISAVFIVFGYIQFTHIGNYIANPAVIKVAGWTGILTPTIIAYMVASIDLFGGILVLVGYQTALDIGRADRVRRAHVHIGAQFLDHGRSGARRQSRELLQEPRSHRRTSADLRARPGDLLAGAPFREEVTRGDRREQAV